MHLMLYHGRINVVSRHKEVHTYVFHNALNDLNQLHFIRALDACELRRGPHYHTITYGELFSAQMVISATPRSLRSGLKSIEPVY